LTVFSFLFFGKIDRRMPFFSPPVTLDIVLDDQDTRPTVTVGDDKEKTIELPRFVGSEDIKGRVVVTPHDPSKRIDHQGIHIEFIGQIELYYDRGNHYDFTSLQFDLAPAGYIQGPPVELEFEFLNAEKQYESYNGANVRLRYFLRATMIRSGFSSNVVKEMEIWVINYHRPPEMNNTIKMEVGIEDCLHIEFEYNKSKYHLRDVIIGKIYFLLVRIRIKHMELCLLRRETSGQPPNTYNETETLTNFELMDGAPVKGEIIPVRLFLRHFDLTPTYRNVHSKFCVKYYINLVLVDEEDRRYFKQQEIYLWRRAPSRSTVIVPPIDTSRSSGSIPELMSPSTAIAATGELEPSSDVDEEDDDDEKQR